jgi:dimethylhistidine N-methyltransferase
MYTKEHTATRPDLTMTPPASDLIAEAVAGLLHVRKTLPPHLFYDAQGVRLFQKITQLPEYYLTRTELALLETVAPAAVSRIPTGSALVEYGASDETKADFLLRQTRDLSGPVFHRYVPIDLAADGLENMRNRLWRSYPNLRVHTLVMDFCGAIVLPAVLADVPRVGFFPGSTIGNFDKVGAHRLLERMRDTLGMEGRLLIGVDLRKDPFLLLPAYNDGAGVTAAFNRNLLARLNREAGADFDLEAFAHIAVWNDGDSRIEMHLVSLREQLVHVAGRAIHFVLGETIHTENSYKHTVDGFSAIVRQAGWRVRDVWTDAKSFFGMFLLDHAPPLQ